MGEDVAMIQLCRRGSACHTRFRSSWRERAGARCTRSETSSAGCGKRSHMLARLIGVRLIEVEPVAFGHTIQAASIDPEDLGGAFLVALGRVQYRLDVLLF
jgi:hypothetical protein